MTEYKMSLSTTEPNNFIGLVKIRQADENTQVFVANIYEGGIAKSFKGLVPFFCLMPQGITGQGITEEKVQSFDDTKGSLRYTVSANAMQYTGENIAYFSFRKSNGDGTFSEQFSTRNFAYLVEKSIYTVEFKDSNYWWTFKELVRQFENWISDTKDIINSLDPSGKILGELIDARGTYTKLADRLATIENDAKSNNSILDEKFTTRINDLKNQLQELVDAVADSEQIDVVENKTELLSKYPNGRKGLVFTRDNAHYWYYVKNSWTDGGEIFKNPSYTMLNPDGTYINLNLSQQWRSNPDITTLNTGYFIAYIQMPRTSEEQEQDPNTVYPNPNYPMAINFPQELRGVLCSIKVLKYPKLEEDYIRVDYEVRANYSNKVWIMTKRLDGSLTPWEQIISHNTDTNPRQMYRLTFASGVSPSFKYASNNTTQKNSANLAIPITQLNSGFYMGSINKDAGDTEGFSTIKRLQLPQDFPVDQFCNVSITRTDTNRKTILLTAMYTNAVWMGTTGTNNTLVAWKRLDKDVDISEADIANYIYKLNDKKAEDSTLLLMITDTHAQDKDLTTQKGYINPTLFNDFEKITNSLDYVDYNIHLGDWIDGNNRPELSRVSLVKYPTKFYKLPNSYGIIGNHDWNGVWGEQVQKDPMLGSGYFTQKDMARYFIPKKAKTSKTYYSLDDDKKKLRLIFLNTFDLTMNTYPNGKLVNSPLNQPAITAEQVKWLISTLSTVPSGYNVIVIGHAPLDNVFSDSIFFNGDTVRTILEKYQSKGSGVAIESDIDSNNNDLPSYKLSETYDFSNSTGKILSVFNGHIHRDKTVFLNGIRYISLLCARPDAGTDEGKPPRDYYDVTKNAISAIEITKDAKTINLYRYGAGKDYTFNTLSE